jgi:hypothetical protein
MNKITLPLYVIFTFSLKITITKVSTPHFHKPRDLGWWIVVGDVKKGELLALKKLPMGDKRLVK